MLSNFENAPYLLFFNKFLLLFLENMFHRNFFLKFKFFKKLYNVIEKKLLYFNFYKKYFKIQFKIGRGFFFKEMLKVIWLTFFLKDCRFFLYWLQKTMERLYFKSHKKFLAFLKTILIHYFNLFSLDLKYKGFYFDIRGKVGVAGNAKKRHFFIRAGRYSLSEKNLKWNFFQHIVRTKTGVLGTSFCITF